MKKLYTILVVLSAIVVLTSCEKVSPIGVLVSGTGVEDRVKMSHLYFLEHKLDIKYHDVSDQDEYTFLVGADSHLTTDVGRLQEMLDIGLDNDDLLYAHLGDIADTKPEYYVTLEDLLDDYRWKYAKKHFKPRYMGSEDDPYSKDDPRFYFYLDTIRNVEYNYDEIRLPFYPVVGNHDITHNGWALWSNIFHSSFYDVYVIVDNEPLTFDHFIFIDTANGTLGEEQVKLIEQGVLNGKNYTENGYLCRFTFVFSHTNIFRPSSLQFASTFAREETFFLLEQFRKWDTDIVFCGHVHKWDEQEVGITHYITLDSMSERNNPKPGDYLVRVHVRKDGTLSWERVHMNYTPGS
ncbi:MAG: metallophosphoesterase [Prevotella sp.]|nr:metallophosphoesterase [Prevotella sp.]